MQGEEKLNVQCIKQNNTYTRIEGHFWRVNCQILTNKNKSYKYEIANKVYVRHEVNYEKLYIMLLNLMYFMLCEDDRGKMQQIQIFVLLLLVALSSKWIWITFISW